MTTTTQPAPTAILTPFAEEWLAALESGEFIQATNQLRDEHGGRCCLGVACEINDPKLWVVSGTTVVGTDRWEYLSRLSCLPESVRDRLGLAYDNGDFVTTDDFLDRLPKELAERVALVSAAHVADEQENVGDEYQVPDGLCTLACLNDNGFNFVEIATVIRARPQGLFASDACIYGEGSD